MLFLYELKLKSLEVQAKASPKALIFFDPIAEGFYDDAMRTPSNSAQLFDFVKSTPNLKPSSAQYIVLKDGSVIENTPPAEQFVQGNYGATKTLSNGVILHRLPPEENANGRH